MYAAQGAAAAQMYAAAAAPGYPGYLGYPAYSPMQAAAYYPSLAAYSYPGMQPAQLRPTIMVPNSFDAGARFDGIAQPVLPPAPPGVAPNAAQLAAMAGHNVALTQKKGSFLAGGSDGGYTFW
ncbi:DAZ-associated protein 2 [Gryllus bimaculatus]|nr:DAZ-associated protein 2 [Gryllus bimaculatus]